MEIEMKSLHTRFVPVAPGGAQQPPATEEHDSAPVIELRQVLTIAHKELRDRLRNRWVLAVALVFTVFALVIAYFGGAQQGAVGLRSIEFTITSLVSLVIYLIPLIALLLGFDAIVGERERGSLELLLALPVTRFELLLGKYIGLAAALTLSTTAGFGLVAALLVAQTGTAGLEPYAGFMFSSVLLGLAFLSLAVMLSVLAVDRTRASGLAIAMWFFFVLVFDLLLLGGLVASGGETGAEWFPYLLLLNPADVFRILNIFSLDDVRTLYGLTSIVPAALAKPWLMALVMLGWIALPLAIANWRFRP
jgi:Cu-processing system permease protein